MLDVISVENMRRSDANTIASFVPSKELMWRASEGIFNESVKANPNAFSGSTVIVVGSGNNGGDGFGLAVVLKSKNFNVTILSVANHYSEDAKYYMDKAMNIGVEVLPFASSLDILNNADTIVDCLLGTGFKGEVKASYKDAIDAINSSSAYVISADINSGLDGDTGEAIVAVESDLTVTIGYHKKGILLAKGSRFIKSVSLAPIGIVLDKSEDYLLTPEEWLKRGFDANKSHVTSEDGITYFNEGYCE